jgi:hypothetical protein
MMSYWIRTARRLGWDRNPLRRPVDRAETAILAVLAAALVIAGPLLAVFAGRSADEAGLRAQRAERGWYQVPATLLQSASEALVTTGETDIAWVRARWTDHAGDAHTGSVSAALNARAGQRVQIWVTAAGQQTYPRPDAAVIRDQVIIAAGLAGLGWCAVIVVGAAAVRALADRRRLAGWEHEWDAAGPRWSHHG